MRKRKTTSIIAGLAILALVAGAPPPVPAQTAKDGKKSSESAGEKSKSASGKSKKDKAGEEESGDYDPNDLEFDKLKEQFEAEKGKQPYERVITIEKFGDYPTKRTVPFLKAVLADEKGSPGIIGSVVRALGKIATKEAMVVIMEAAPLLIGDINITAIATALANPLEEEAEDWIIKNGLTPEIRKDREATKVVIEAIAHFKSEKKIAFLQGELKRATAPELKISILLALRDSPPKDAAKIVAPFLKDPDPGVLVATLQVLDAVKARQFAREYIALLKSKSWQVRAMAVELLGAIGHAELVRATEPLLDDPEVRVRIGVVQAYIMTGGDAVVMPLIKALGKKENEGRVADDIADGLARLTGKNYGPNAANWESWWNSNKGKVKVEKRPPDEFAKLKESDGEQRTAVYFGLRVISKNIAFVIDTSASMTEAYVPLSERKEDPGPAPGEPGKTTVQKREKKASPGASAKGPMTRKIDVAKSELTKVLSALPLGIKVNIIRFNSSVDPWKDALTALATETKKEALEFVKASKPEGMTDVYAALEAAFKDERLDTIYLLSDGAPTLGKIETEDILEELEKLNQLRKVKINTIGFHLKPEERKLMQEIAERNFGVFLTR